MTSGHSRPAAGPPWALALAVIVMLAAGCDRAPEETRLRFSAMGTLVEVTIYDFPADEAHRAATDVEALFRRLQKRWDPWDTEGALGRLNEALAAGDAALPDPELAALLGRAADLSRASGGLFEPAVGGLVRVWGFDHDDAPPTAPPAAETVAAALAAVRPLAAAWRPGEITGPPGMALDLGGFAKGEAVDRTIALLRERGVGNAIVNAGGDLRAIGDHGDRPWRIGVRHPRSEGMLASLEISGDESVFTSGDYERFFIHDGVRYHHILDPRTGYPAPGATSVTVIHADAAVADAAATALFVAGPDDWPSVAAALGVQQVMLVDADGIVHLSPAMAERVKILAEPAPATRIEALP